MKLFTTALLLASCSAMAQPAAPAACSMTMSEARAKVPDLADLTDDGFVHVLQRAYYPHLTPDQLAAALCVKLQPAKPAKALNAFERWRYEGCQGDAAKAPTERGVQVGLRLCREKFEQ